MTEPRDDRIAERVDAPASAEVVNPERLVVARDRVPQGSPAFHHPLKDLVGKRPRTRPRRVQRSATPSIDDELDVASGSPLDKGLLIGAERFEVPALRGNERQLSIVEHRTHDDGADGPASVADPATGVQHVTLRGPERRYLLEGVPIVA